MRLLLMCSPARLKEAVEQLGPIYAAIAGAQLTARAERHRHLRQHHRWLSRRRPYSYTIVTGKYRVRLRT